MLQSKFSGFPAYSLLFRVGGFADGRLEEYKIKANSASLAWQKYIRMKVTSEGVVCDKIRPPSPNKPFLFNSLCLFPTMKDLYCLVKETDGVNLQEYYIFVRHIKL